MKKETMYLIGVGILGFAVVYHLTKPTQETTSEFAGKSDTKVDCLTREQIACLTSDVTKRQMLCLKNVVLVKHKFLLTLRKQKK
jgi:hypothetical protein